ncbi:hypothetical protein IC757_14960 [Wenzhouxiangella sp. AB-CW3]|uniref:hypothetical protein n=1 Tax=Wenzhouxiangella sp. AB-CW3 TaxID=2771012 RepID=UPI00168B776D|nr:hypothetical protein [Wenzhouxiangella sp. AB-CW3]QOC22299.1 hypothetical protein IC757_14960 [Wenzhouxiangella sp. AB-CW3]
MVPRCKGLEADPVETDGAWIAPAGCSVITWNVTFQRVEGPGVDLSEQSNLYYPGGWWLLTEWNDLLRPSAGSTPESICATDGNETICRTVPALDEAPLFLMVGQPDCIHTIGGTTFRFFHGLLPVAFDARELHRGLEQQLAYLRSLSPDRAGPSPNPEVIDVLILGIDESLDRIGGAAGHGAWLANVAVSDSGIKPSEMVRFQWITGHELFHLLDIDQAPLWASESLAHYYGFKSLGENPAAESLFEQMLEQVPDMGLLDAHHRVAQQGESQYYGLFYFRGADFWRALDALLGESTNGEEDLDAFLTILRDEEFGPGGELPETFVESVRKRTGSQALSELLSKYL